MLIFLMHWFFETAETKSRAEASKITTTKARGKAGKDGVWDAKDGLRSRGF